MRSALEVHVAAKTRMPGTSPGMTIFGTSRNFIGLCFESVRSPDGAQRNPGIVNAEKMAPDFAALHPGYKPAHDDLLAMTALTGSVLESGSHEPFGLTSA